MKRQRKAEISAGLVVVVIAMVSAVIGFAIVDSIAADTVVPGNINQTVGTANDTGYFSGTLTYTPLSTPIVYADGNVETDNVTVAIGSTSLVTEADSNNFIDAEIIAYYTYDDATYLSGGLSRIIVQYIVPIGLLAVLGIAAGLAMRAS